MKWADKKTDMESELGKIDVKGAIPFNSIIKIIIELFRELINVLRITTKELINTMGMLFRQRKS